LSPLLASKTTPRISPVTWAKEKTAASSANPPMSMMAL
jgi:hypothetical protein